VSCSSPNLIKAFERARKNGIKCLAMVSKLQNDRFGFMNHAAALKEQGLYATRNIQTILMPWINGLFGA